MRDYTRKAKRVDNGEWISGYLVSCDERYFIAEVPECDTCKYMYEGYWFGTFYEVDPDTICNPTGLTDKNGNKIWENDIIKDSDNDVGIINYGMDGRASFVVYYDNKTEYILLGKNNIEMLKIEVIGNTFDNADLLKGE